MAGDIETKVSRDKEAGEFEAIEYICDQKTGLRAYIAVHSTVRGPACGGCRLWTYVSDAAARADAMKIARGMSYKNALADLPLGGGKAVIMKPRGDVDRAALFQAFGRAVQRLNGQYITAEDVGVSPADMAEIHKETDHVAGLASGKNASGDPSPVTAEGVYRAIKLAARRRMGRENLRGVRVAVQGLGHVGWRLAEQLARSGAHLIVTDIDEKHVARAVHRFGAEAVSPEAIYDVPHDVFAPCALGGTVSKDTVPRLSAMVICGAANNQLASQTLGKHLLEQGVLYVPDYAANAGGIINVASELSGHYDKAWVLEKLAGLEATADTILSTSERQWRPTSDVADELARARLV